MPLRALNVIKFLDEMVSPPHPKMVVCLCPSNGLFVRINSRGHWPGSVPIACAPEHQFLDHDSFIECGNLLELDDYIAESAAVLGNVSNDLVPWILRAIENATTVRPRDKELARASLAPLLPI